MLIKNNLEPKKLIFNYLGLVPLLNMTQGNMNPAMNQAAFQSQFLAHQAHMARLHQQKNMHMKVCCQSKKGIFFRILQKNSLSKISSLIIFTKTILSNKCVISNKPNFYGFLKKSLNQ